MLNDALAKREPLLGGMTVQATYDVLYWFQQHKCLTTILFHMKTESKLEGDIESILKHMNSERTKP